MKKIYLLLIFMNCVITSATANAVRFEDKMQILAHLNRTKAVIGFHGEVVSPYVLTQIVNSRTAATDSGMVFISGDTMQIAYYNLKSKKLDKIETYYAKDYITGTGELVMDGKQSYFLDGKLLCEEIIQNNTLKKTVWYLADGTSDRSYIFRNNRLTQQIQHYPSGKIKWMEIYLPNGSVQQRIFSEDGQPAEISEPSISEGFETFERYFNRHFLMDRFLKNGEYTVCLHVNAEGQSELIIWDNNKIKYPHHFASTQPIWSPATINGKTSAFTIVRKLRYQPFMFIQNGDTVHVAPSVGESASIHGFKWHDCQLWMPSSVDTSDAYATCERTANTITMSCYDSSNQLKTQQVFGYAPGDSLSTVQGSRGFNFKTFKESLRELTQDWNLVLFTKYQNGQRVYREHLSNGFCDTMTWYYPDQSIRYAIYMKPEPNIHTYKELLEYYPTGELKMSETSEKTAGTFKSIYFNREGKAVKPEMPKLPKGVGKSVFKQFMANNIDLRQTTLNKYSWMEISGEVDVYVEVDENGHANYLEIGSQLGKLNYTTQNGQPNPISKSIEPVDHMLKREVLPLMLQCLQTCEQPWIAGMIDGVPQTLRTKITIEFCFKKDALVR